MTADKTIPQDALKPCPCCGGIPYVGKLLTKESYWVRCHVCGLRTSFSVRKEIVIERWNRRTP